MVTWKSGFLALIVLPFASALITGIVPHSGTFTATPDYTTSLIDVTFNWTYTKVSYYDFTISFAVIKPADQAGPNTIGAPLRKNIDLIATNNTNIGSPLTVSVPVTTNELYNGAGNYTFIAIVNSASGIWPQLVHFTTKYSFTLAVAT